MIHKTKGIVLNTFKYSDNSVVSTIYTEQFGRLSFLVNGVHSKKSKTKFNLLQQLFILDLDIYYKDNRGLQKIKEIKPDTIIETIPFDIVKSSLAILIAEILNKTLKEEEKNKSLYNFLYNSIKILDASSEGKSDFHLLFLLKLTKFLGILPKNNYSENYQVFDMVNGEFVQSRIKSETRLNTGLSKLISHMLTIDYSNLQTLKLNKEKRNSLLENILLYYKLHIPEFYDIKSLKVFKEVFS